VPSKPKKRPPKKTAPKKSILLKMDIFVHSLQEQYPNDPSCPGITISYLPGLRMYYASIVRFSQIYGKGSYAIANTKADTIEETLAQLLDMWLSRIAPSKDATEQLVRERN
jgi:hypothetical protein